jgi:A/G-specific adenine glycosylase
LHLLISDKINQWYSTNGRQLAWRGTNDPYLIWLSEIIMQQTRVEQGTPYYLRFAEEYPMVSDLAKAKEDEVLKLWQGLGYYSRARNLHHTAKTVMDKMNGSFPRTYNELIMLKGIGKYTAAAIASISSEELVAAIDGNVNRVVSRLFSITEATHTSSFTNEVKEHADLLISNQKPSQHNQAMMDFGAMVCTPKNPQCLTCPVQEHCLAYQQGLAERLPVKTKKTKKTDRYFHIAVVQSGNRTIVEKRDNQGIWASLWQFPMIETKSKATLSLDFFQEEVKARLKRIVSIAEAPKHILSHQNIHAIFYHIEADHIEKDLRNVPIKKLAEVALPRLIDRFLENHEWLKTKEK